MIDIKNISASNSHNFILECDPSLDFNNVLSEVQTILKSEKSSFFSQEFFFFDSLEINTDSISKLQKVQHTSQFLTLFFHNVDEFYRIFTELDFDSLSSKDIFFIFVIPPFDISNFKENNKFLLFSHIYLENLEDPLEIIDPLFENKPIKNLSGFDLFEKSGFSQLSDHYKVDFILKNNYSKETIKRMSFFGIISNEIKEYLLKIKSEQETYVEKISYSIHSIKTYFLSIF